MQDWVASAIWLHRRSGELNQANPVFAFEVLTSLAALSRQASRSAMKAGLDVFVCGGG